MFRVIIAGGRKFDDYTLLKSKCDHYLLKQETVIIVSGKAKGADTLGEQYAQECDFDIKEFPADWNKYGKRAGYLRNQEMANYADGLIAFWNGESKGTKHMIDIAKKGGLKVKIVKYVDS